jgi:LuxR family transcriptional regulator, maltose regulon positive regulatory protein
MIKNEKRSYFMQRINQHLDQEYLKNDIQLNAIENSEHIIDSVNFRRPNKLAISMLGEFKITLDDIPIKLKRKSSTKLLQILLASHGKKIPKDLLVETLFQNGNIETVNNHFYVTLSILRKTLEPNLINGRESKYIVQSDTHYYFNSEDVYLDIIEFEKLSSWNDQLPIHHQIQNLIKAEALYNGMFFEEYPYECYLEKCREKLHLEYIKLLKRVANYYWDQHNYSLGIEYFEKILYSDPYREDIYIEYIERLLKTNNQVTAKMVARKCIKFIEKELGIQVKPQLNKLLKPFSLTV